MRMRRGAVAVSSQEIARHLAAGHEYKDSLDLKNNRRSFATIDLSDEEAEAITSSHMDSRHDHLNKLLDPK
jgi:hypothetical protein